MSVSRDGDSYLVAFNYDQALVEDLMRCLPSWHRRWDRRRNCWVISALVWRDAERIFADHSLLESPFSTPTPWDLLHLKSTAPPELVTATFRILARRHHPDVGGNHRQMVEINRAYERLRGGQ
jgi:hypothetical protein